MMQYGPLLILAMGTNMEPWVGDSASVLPSGLVGDADRI